MSCATASVALVKGCFNITKPPGVTVSAKNEAPKLQVIFGANRERGKPRGFVRLHPPFTTEEGKCYDVSYATGVVVFIIPYFHKLIHHYIQV